MKPSRLTRFLPLTLAGITMTLPVSAGTWDGGSEADSNTGTAANWVGDTLPNASGATIIFDGNTRTDVFNNYLTNVAGMTFASGAGHSLSAATGLKQRAGQRFRTTTA